MPFDQYYGSSGVDVIYPSQMMNPHHFSEPEWNPAPLGHSSSYSSDRSYPHRDNSYPLHPHDYEVPYSAPDRPPPIQVSNAPTPASHFSRPKSSPSTFGPNVEDLLFTENPFKLKNEDYGAAMFSMSPQPIQTKAPSPFFDAPYPASSASHSPGRHQGPIPIAPDPVGLRQMNALKRMREDEEFAEYGQRKRKRAPSQSGPIELNEEEQLLLKLKEEENLPWKDIAIRFQTELGKSYQVPALQMRFKRLRERMRTWTDIDVGHHFSFLYPLLACDLTLRYRFKHSNKLTTTGKSSNSRLSPQRSVITELSIVLKHTVKGVR